MFTQADAAAFCHLLTNGTDAQVQSCVHPLRTRCQAKLTDLDERREFVYLLARLVKSVHFFTCFVTYAPPINEFAAFAEYVGPQLIKAAVEHQGTIAVGSIKVKAGPGKKGAGPPPKKVSVQDMIDELRAKCLSWNETYVLNQLRAFGDGENNRAGLS